MGIRQIVLCLALVPYFCWAATDEINRIGGLEKLDMVLKKKLTINDQKVTLQDIYGDVKLTGENFKPGLQLIDSLLHTDDANVVIERADYRIDPPPGDQYIDRKFSSISLNVHYEDAPTEIAMSLVTDIEDPKIHQLPLTLIIGDINSGKSAALDKIRMKLVEISPALWTITINLQKLATFDEDIPNLKLDYIIDNYIPNVFRDLFRNVLELNAKKIVFMLDNVDKMSKRDGRAAATASLIKDLADAGSTLVVTGRYYTKELVKGHNVKLYEIPEMNIFEASNFLSNYWNKEFGTDMSKIEYERLNDYAVAFTHALFKTTIPRSPSPLLVLVDEFQHAISSNTVKTNFPLGAFEYVRSHEPLSSRLMFAIENVILQKYNLYTKIINEITKRNRQGIGDPVLIYGAAGASKMIKNNGLSNSEVWRMAKIDTTTPTLIAFKERAFFTNYNGKELEFINIEYQNYYAMEYFLKHFFLHNDGEYPEMLRQIVSDSNFKDVLEFLNPRIQILQFDEIECFLYDNHQRLITQVLDNVLANGCESFMLHIVEILEEENRLIDLNNYFKGTQLIEYQSKRILGMTLTTRMHPDLEIPESVPTKKGTILEVIVEHNMFGLCQQLHKLDISFHANQDWQNLLRIAVTKSIPNIEHIKFIIDKLIPNNSPIDYTDLLYHTINEVGDVEFAKQLMRSQTNIMAPLNGRTLLHAAVQWSNVDLVKFLIGEVHEIPDDLEQSFKFTDTADNSGRTIFDTALDANPSIVHTNPTWWEMMLYLTKYVTFTDSIQHQILPGQQRVSPGRYVSPWLQYLFPPQYITANSESQNQVPLNDHTIKRISKIARLLPSHLWPIESKTLAVARNLLLFDTVEFMKRNNKKSLPDALFSLYRERLQELLESYRTKNPRLDETHWAITLEIEPSEIKKSFEICTEIVAQRELTGNLKNPISDRLSIFKSHSGMSSSSQGEIMNIENFEDVKSLQCREKRKRRSIISSSTNCLSYRRDVAVFDDAPNNQRRSIFQIQVNSDRFLNTLAAVEYNNPDKAKQLVTLVRYLDKKAEILNRPVLSGDSTIHTLNVLRAGSLTAYRQTQRNKIIMGNIVHSSSNKNLRFFSRLPSRSVALYAAAALPFVRGIYETVITCLQQHNETNNNCLYASTVLVLAGTLIPAGFVTVKYTPLLLEHGTTVALDILPSTAPSVIREDLKLLRLRGLKYGGQTAAVAIGVLGMGFDLYNIIQVSNMINECKQQATNCNSKDNIDHMISLSFSCVSISATVGFLISGVGFAAGILVGLGLVMLETLAFGINDVIYYHNRYDTTVGENFRIFFHKIGFQPPPQDVQRLARRTDWMHNLESHAVELLNSSNDNIVAYGVGLGTLTASGIVAGYGDINMKDTKQRNSAGLSRVLPNGNAATLLCLPKRNISEVYDTKAKKIQSAVYGCKNSFVVAHKKRWATNGHSKFYIVYDLTYVNNGNIIGSNNENNLFLIHNGTSTLNICGGGNNTKNIYILQGVTFNGMIILNDKSREDIVDLSHIQSSEIDIIYSNEFYTKHVQLDGKDNKLFIQWPKKLLNNLLRIIGRETKIDTMNCKYSQYLRDSSNRRSITVDSRGGQSLSKMDYVQDCEVSVVRPFTYIIGSNDSEVTYTTLVSLDVKPSIDPSNSEVTIIQPLQSKFIVTFTNRPLFSSTTTVTFSPSNGTLTWQLNYSGSSSLLLLSIEPFRSSQKSMRHYDNDVSNIEEINCIFVDTYMDGIVYPELHLPTDNESETINVEHFNFFSNVNISRYRELVEYYQNSIATSNIHLIVRSKLTYQKTGATYTFGSMESDRFYIDSNSTFVFGDNERDIYSLNSNSSDKVWINNEATDDALDSLIIPDTTCDDLTATVGSETTEFIDGSSYDVTISCAIRTMTDSYKKVILYSYLLGSEYQHLQIYWRGNTYMPLPPSWRMSINQNNTDARFGENVPLALFFSFDKNWQSTILTLTANDTFVVLGTANSANSLAAYRSRIYDLILVKQYLGHDGSSFVMLKEFFAKKNSSAPSTQWLETEIFIIEQSSGNYEDVTVMHADDIEKLYLKSLDDDKMENGRDADLIQEYTVNMTENTGNSSIIIEHNKGSKNEKLGVLTVIGAQPINFQTRWNDTERTLKLCTIKTCILIKNWCRSAQFQLYQIEFAQSLSDEPIVIRNLDRISCPKKGNNNDIEYFISKFNETFVNAQKRMILNSVYRDDDHSLLLKCVASIFADIVADKSMYKLFGFSSIIQQAEFMSDHCIKLFAQSNVQNLELPEMEAMMKNKIELFQLRKRTQRKNQLIERIKLRLQQLDKKCWKKFITSLYKYYNKIEMPVDSFDILNKCHEEENLILKASAI